MRNKSEMGYITCLCLSVLVFLVIASPSVNAKEQRLLMNVKTDSPLLDASQKEQVAISWDQAHEGTIDVMICNLDGKVVRTLMEKAHEKSGPHQVQWDGLDDNGGICPDDAYIPIIRIRTDRFGNDIHNPSVLPWGGRVEPSNLRYDESRGKIVYTLNNQAMCLIRVGEKDGGPVYKTVLNWQPRNAGDHEEAWDGMDLNGIVQAARKDNFFILLDAFSLPEGSIMIKGSKTGGKSNANQKQFPIYPPRGENVFLHAFHQKDVRHDISISAILKNPSGMKGQIPTVQGNTTLEVSVNNQKDIDQIMREKFEIYFFIEGKLVFENPMNTIPAIVKLDTTQYPNGEQIVTINLRTTEDRVGTCSLKVNIEN